jgi:hypothetical protein
VGRWSGKRGYVEPLAALAGVLALGVALTLYAGALNGTAPSAERHRATVVLDSTVADAAALGVLGVSDLEIPETPAGWSVNLTLETVSGRWTYGDPPSPTADRSSRRVSVRVEPGSVEPGQLRVAVW